MIFRPKTMEAANAKSFTGLDRLATRNEVLRAISLTPNGAYEIRCTSDGYCEMKSDIYGWVRILNEDLGLWEARGEIQKPAGI